jgi:integrase
MATITKRIERGREYVVLNWSQHGIQERKQLGPAEDVSPQQARIALAAKQLELDTGRPVFVAAPPFEKHVADYLIWHAGEYPDSHERVKQICEQHLLGKDAPQPDLHPSRHFRAKLLSQITAKDVDMWKAERRKEVTSGSVLKEFNTLNAIFNRAIAWKCLAHDGNPCADAKRPKSKSSKPPVWYSVEQLQIIYQRPTHGEHWRFQANTGLRRGEMLNLSPDQVDETRREVHVISQEDEDEDGDGSEGRTKSGLHRTVPLSDAALAAFKECMRDRENQDRVVPRINPASYSRAFKSDAARCQLPGSLHSLRHSYAAHMLLGGLSLRELMDLLGHADIQTTMIYAHISPSRVKDVAVRISI